MKHWVTPAGNASLIGRLLSPHHWARPVRYCASTFKFAALIGSSPFSCLGKKRAKRSRHRGGAVRLVSYRARAALPRVLLRCPKFPARCSLTKFRPLPLAQLASSAAGSARIAPPTRPALTTARSTLTYNPEHEKNVPFFAVQWFCS